MSANFIFAILVPEVVIKYDCRKQLETNEEVSQAITRQTTENQTMREWTTTKWESMTADLRALTERVQLLEESLLEVGEAPLKVPADAEFWVSQATITRQTTENQTMQEWTTTRWESMTDLWELMERVELLAEQVELLTERVELLTERVELLTERVHIRKTQDFLNTT
jgi:uncharacterized protein YoxC